MPFSPRPWIGANAGEYKSKQPTRMQQTELSTQAPSISEPPDPEELRRISWYTENHWSEISYLRGRCQHAPHECTVPSPGMMLAICKHQSAIGSRWTSNTIHLNSWNIYRTFHAKLLGPVSTEAIRLLFLIEVVCLRRITGSWVSVVSFIDDVFLDITLLRHRQGAGWQASGVCRTTTQGRACCCLYAVAYLHFIVLEHICIKSSRSTKSLLDW